MIKFVSRIALTTAAVGMAFTPIAAQANTRAGDSSTVYSAPASQPGAQRTASGENLGAGTDVGTLIVALLAGAAILAGIVILEDDGNNDPVSPGAN